MDDSSVSPELVGILLLLLTFVLVGLAAWLAWEGLKTTQAGDGDGSKKLENVQQAVTEATAEIQAAIAPETSFMALSQEQLDAFDAEELAAKTEEVTNQLESAKTKLDQASTSLNSISFGEVFDPLKGALAALTGRQAPARAFLAFALVTLVLSLVAFGTLDFSVATDTGGGATTPTEPTGPSDPNQPPPGGTSSTGHK